MSDQTDDKSMFESPVAKQTLIDQGYVPQTCTLSNGLALVLLFAEVPNGNNPCWGCNEDRARCNGHPKQARR